MSSPSEASVTALDSSPTVPESPGRQAPESRGSPELSVLLIAQDEEGLVVTAERHPALQTLQGSEARAWWQSALQLRRPQQSPA